MRFGPSFRASPSLFCPVCKAQLDGATGIDNDRTALPDNALTICAYCTSKLVYRGGRFEIMAQEEFDALPLTERKSLENAIAMVTRYPPPSVSRQTKH